MRDEWTTTTLGEIADIRIGRTPPRKDGRYWTDDLTRPCCTIADMDGPLVTPRREGVTELAEQEGKAKRVPAGSLLMSFKLTIGRVGITAVDVFPNEAIAWLEPSTAAIDRRFLGLWLGATNVAADAGRAVKGNTLNGDSLRAIAVCFPPLVEQRRIMDLIDAIDQARALATAEHAAALRAAAAVIDTTLREADSALRLGDYAMVRGGKRLPKGTPWAERPTAHPYIRVVDIKGGSVDTSALVYVPEDVWPTIRRYVVEANDVIISIVGTIGEVAVVPRDLAGANLTENAALIRVARRLIHRSLQPSSRVSAAVLRYHASRSGRRRRSWPSFESNPLRFHTSRSTDSRVRLRLPPGFERSLLPPNVKHQP
jgi:type I restriction enzyme S subunit